MNSLENLIVEPKINFEDDSFDYSLQKLRNRGYQRHMLPQEVLPFLAEHQPEYLSKNWVYFWLSMAIRREGSKLDIAFNPENLYYHHSKGEYLIRNEENEIRCSERRTFNLENRPLLYGRNDLPEELLKFLFGPDYSELLDKIKGKGREAAFFLSSYDGPTSKKWCPCSFAMSPSIFSIGMAYRSRSLGAKEKEPAVVEKEVKIISEGVCVRNSIPCTNHWPSKGGSGE